LSLLCVFAAPANGGGVPEPEAADAALDEAIAELVAAPVDDPA
jgi:hypothetical protein